MDLGLAKPFARSVQHVLATLMQIDVDVGEPRAKPEPQTTHAVSGIVALSGGVHGVLVVSMPEATARRLVALFIGRDSAPGEPEFADAIAELTAMIVGGAKGALGSSEKVTMQCPSVVVGRRHAVSRPDDTQWWAMNCDSDCGDLTIELALARTPAPTLALDASTVSHATIES